MVLPSQVILTRNTRWQNGAVLLCCDLKNPGISLPKNSNPLSCPLKKKCLFLENKVLCEVNKLFFKNHCLEMPYFELSQSPRLYQTDKSMSFCLWPAGQKLPPN